MAQKKYHQTVGQFELRKKENAVSFEKVNISRSQDAAVFARNFFFDDINIYESFFLILLNRRNNTIGYVKISQGGIAGTIVDKKLVAKYAIESLCSGIIMVHNHPSGEVSPSINDKQITKDVKQALMLFDIQVLDHIILTETNHYSFQDEGEI